MLTLGPEEERTSADKGVVNVDHEDCLTDWEMEALTPTWYLHHCCFYGTMALWTMIYSLH